MKHYFPYFVIAALVLNACVKTVDGDELLNAEPKVFISSYLSPADTVFRVQVSRALPAIGTPLSYDFEANEATFLIKDAQVTISDEAGNRNPRVEVGLGHTDSSALGRGKPLGTANVRSSPEQFGRDPRQYFGRRLGNGSVTEFGGQVPRRYAQ